MLCPLLCAILCCGALLLAGTAQAADISWLAAVSGTWDDGTKWSGGVPPDAGDSAIITVPPGIGGYGILVDDDVDIDRLVLGAAGKAPNFSVDAATFQIQGLTASTIDTGSGTMTLSNLAVFRFQGPANVVSDLSFEGGVGGGGTWFNEDVLTFDGGAAAIYDLDEVFDNSGTLAVDSGLLLISDALTHTGALDVASGAEAEFDIAGITHTIGEGASFGGDGTVTVAIQVTLDITATTPPTVGSGLDFDLFGTLAGGSFTVDGTMLLEGVAEGTGTLRNRGLLVASGGLDTKSLANESMLEIDDLNLFGGADVDNEAGGLLTLADTSIDPFEPGSTVTNAGTLRKDTGAGLGKISVPVTSTGTVEATSGTLELTDFTQTAGTTTVTATLTSNNVLDIQGGILEGTGTVDADVDLGGTLRAGIGGPGTLALDGDLQFVTGGRLLAEISGTTAGSGYDQVTITGTASLGGTLELVLIDAFSPGLGDSFTVLAGATSGSFDTLDLPTLAPGLTWQVTTDPVTATVVVDPDFIFADGFESGDFDAWTSTTGAFLGSSTLAADAEEIVVELSGLHRSEGATRILSARGVDRAEIFGLDLRRRGRETQIRLRVAGSDQASQWVDVPAGSEISIRYRPALAQLGDGAVFLEVDGRLSAWQTELTIERPMERLHFDAELVRLETR